MRITLSTPLYIHELGKRSNQEDSYFISEVNQTDTSPFFMVCDGMGGHDKGEVASALVCQSLSSFITQKMGEGRAFDDTLFTDALSHTYDALDQLSTEGKRPGTTLTFLCCHRQGVTTANIGDSRIYHLRPKEGKILFQSRDHSMVFDLYLMGELSFDEMATSPQKNVITKALMPGEDNHHRADMVHIGDVQPDDCFLLCSDGLLEHISNKQLVEIFSHYDDMEEVRRLLIDASDDSADNHTAILLKVAKVEQEEGVTVLDDERSSSCNALNVRPMNQGVAEVEGTAEARDADKSATPSRSAAKEQRPTMVPKKKSKKTPVLTIILAALLVAVLAAIGVLLFKKSPKTTRQASQQEVAQPADSQQRAQPATAPTDTMTDAVQPVESAPVQEEAQSAPAHEASAPAHEASATAPDASTAATARAPHTTPNPTSAPHTTPNPTPAPRTTPNPTTTTKPSSSAAQQRRDNLRDRSVNPNH